jgi:hypothetical protein
MGLGKLVLKLLTKSPRVNGWMAVLATSPYIAYKFNQYFNDGRDHTFSDFARTGIPTIAAFILAYLGTAVLHVHTKETDTGQRTQPGDKKIIKKLEERLLEEAEPSVFLPGKKTIDYGIKDTLFLKYKTGAELEKKAREKQNPALALDAMLLYCGSEKRIDDGYMLLRDAFDWLEGSTPELSSSGKIAYAYQNFMLKIARKLEPRNVSEYILAAAHDSILNPAQAWKWSMLGRMAADEFKLPQRAEMHVFHALLATAQKRDDIGRAWKDAFNVLSEQPQWERLGETRSVTRILKNSEFFSHTLVFKERESREALVKEAEASATLAALVEDITVPRPLYVTKELHNNKYAYIMRYVEGETLYERLKKGDKKDVPRVISALAKIHARFPTAQYEKLDIRKNLEDKLANPQLGATKEVADGILRHYHPVISDINDTALWVWNKDAHPENWIIGEKIGVIDNEGDCLVPAFFDLVNLLEYGDFFGDKEKTSYLIQYITKISQEGKHISIATAMREYYNCLIHRALALTSAWSAPNRQRMKIYRKQTIRKAIFAIDAIREEDKTYYQRCEGDYVMLRHMLDDLHRLIPS